MLGRYTPRRYIDVGFHQAARAVVVAIRDRRERIYGGFSERRQEWFRFLVARFLNPLWLCAISDALPAAPATANFTPNARTEHSVRCLALGIFGVKYHSERVRIRWKRW